MAFVPISIEKKKEVVKKYFAGEKVSRIAREYGVSRDSVYEWSRLAEEAISNILEERGHVNRIMELEKANQEMKEKLTLLQNKYSELSQFSQKYIEANKFEIQPVICDKCGSSVLWKNGIYTKTGYKKHKEKKSIQRYICSNCKANIYLVKKNSKRP